MKGLIRLVLLAVVAVLGTLAATHHRNASARVQPPAAWYAEVCYEQSTAVPGEPISYRMAEGFTALTNSNTQAMEDAAKAIRDGACLLYQQDGSGIDPPLCIPASRITSAQAVPYRGAE